MMLRLCAFAGLLLLLTRGPVAEGTGAGCGSNCSSPALPTDNNMNGTVPFQCMKEWLAIARSGQGITQAPLEASRRFRVDEVSVLKFTPPIILELALGFQVGVIQRLQACVEDFDGCEKPASFVSRPCHGGGQCLFNNSLGHAACVCPAGLTGDRCQTDIDECAISALNECANLTFANCHNLHGSYACECNDGYFGDGRECADINECFEGVHNCHQDASCLNIAGSYNCSCNAGFLGNGTTCEGNICLTSLQPGLCMKVQRLEEKLAERDRYITVQSDNMKLITSTMLAYRADMAAMRRESIAANIGHNARLLELRNETEGFKRRIESFRGDVLRFKQREDNKCGVVSWKSFTQASTPSSVSSSASWNVVFNKTRSDTALHVVYTTSMQLLANNQWTVFQLAVLMEGAECTTPLKTPLVLLSGGGANVYHYDYTPRTLNGVCDSRQSGSVTLTARLTHTAGQTTVRSAYSLYTPINTMYVQEMEPC